MTNRNKIHERSLDVAEADNAVVVTARGHTWVEVVDESGRRVRDEAGNRETVFAVEPGPAPCAPTAGSSAWPRARSGCPRREIVPSGQPALLRLSAAEGTELHPADGVALIPADGEASCALVVEKLSVEGTPLTRRRDTDEVFLRATGGTLQDERGRRIRSTRLSGGEVGVTLVSEAQPKVVTVEAFGHPPLGRASLLVEFA